MENKGYHRLVALNVLHNPDGFQEYFELSTSFDEDDYQGFSLPTMDDNPEARAILRESYERLSKESREILLIMAEIPEELLGLIKTNVYNKINKTLVRRFLRRVGYGPMVINKAFREIQGLLRTMEEVRNEAF